MTNRKATCSFCQKSHRDVGPLVEGPGEVYICGGCVNLCQSIIDQEKHRRNYPVGGVPPVLSAEEIEAKLGQYVSGRQEAKHLLAAAAHCHSERQGRSDPNQGAAENPKTAILLVGSARSSRVYLARVLAHILDAPFALGDARALTEARANAPDPNHPLFKLLTASDFDLQAAQRGIVYIDGVDQSDIHAPLQKLLDQTEPFVLTQGIHLDTANVFFICGGAFPGLDEASELREVHPGLPAGEKDLLAFGMSAKLVRRFQAVIRVAPLDEETLVRIASKVNLKCLFDSSE